jgi:hypothetical protein
MIVMRDPLGWKRVFPVSPRALRDVMSTSKYNSPIHFQDSSN